MNTAEVLDAAANMIEREGWWQGSLNSSVGTCAGLAIGQAAGSSWCNAHDAFTAALFGRPCLPSRIYHWNDAPGRTKAEVVAMLRAVAATERARAARLLPVIVPERVTA